jgi:hypothetical protein
MARGRKAHKARKKPEVPKKDPAASGEKLVDKPAAKKPASTSATPKKPVLKPAVSAQKAADDLTAVVESAPKPASKPPPPKLEPVPDEEIVAEAV